ncbi:ExbD/TolR family protein [Lacipirellula limnantheis]|uniref:Biopolymer transport protein ExbD/TolR n=1 Tax=Lacipirellula limnantheis TaxID=2528024 RepID=A0A517TZT8_9BACT|nr:biopolymer transporter ExbD [Lacipirellula limnantheis]QDT73897.1 Biopolymer transport protein ExbD/TolR [Lacipirellula limnantheis]
MTISFACPLCGKKLSAPESLVGRERTCPKCRASIKVPTAEQAARRKPAGDSHGSSPHGLLSSSGPAHEEDLIDMTAMVDIVFFLLIFFMVTSLSAVESVIGLPPPQKKTSAPVAQATPDLANDPSFISVTIEEDDTVWVEDEQVFGSQSLRVKLRDLRNRDFQPTGMVITCNPKASHGTAVMVLDSGADVGMEDMRLAVTEAVE